VINGLCGRILNNVSFLKIDENQFLKVSEMTDISMSFFGRAPYGAFHVRRG
jgi:hypothetical protein